MFTPERYAYRAWQPNLALTPEAVWHFYDGRAGMERRIREIQEDYALGKIPTRAFAANALYLEVIRLAYNLVTAFQRTCLPKEWKRTKEMFTKIDRLLQRISEKMRDFRPKSQKEAATHAGFKYHSRYWVLGTRYFFVPNFRLKSLAINFPWKRPFSMKISLVIEPATITPAT